MKINIYIPDNIKTNVLDGKYYPEIRFILDKGLNAEEYAKFISVYTKAKQIETLEEK